VTLPDTDPDDARRQVEAFNEAPEMIISKVRKDRSTSLDLKRFVGGVEIVAVNGGTSMRFPVALDPSLGSVKPEEVLRGIFGRDPRAFVVREKLHFSPPPGGGGVNMELGAMNHPEERH
jgi:hypothetical protein